MTDGQIDNHLMALVWDGKPTRLSHLFAVACCRRLWPHLSGTARGLLDLMEAAIDDPLRNLSALRELANGVQPESETPDDAVARLYQRFFAPSGTVESGLRAMDALIEICRVMGWSSPRRGEENAAIMAYTLDIFTFRPEFHAEWRTSTTVALARRIYDLRDFAVLPILADALEESGCANLEILAHCRKPGEHVRGCWVIEELLEWK